MLLWEATDPMDPRSITNRRSGRRGDRARRAPRSAGDSDRRPDRHGSVGDGAAARRERRGSAVDGVAGATFEREGDGMAVTGRRGVGGGGGGDSGEVGGGA